VIIISCSLMIKCCKYQVEKCNNWRVHQHIMYITTQKTNDDLSSITHLHLLIENMMTHCTDIILCICYNIKALLSETPHSEECKEIVALSRNCEELVDFLDGTLAVHNISPSNVQDRDKTKNRFFIKSTKKRPADDNSVQYSETEVEFSAESDQDSFGVLGADWGGEENGYSEIISEISHIPTMS